MRRSAPGNRGRGGRAPGYVHCRSPAESQSHSGSETQTQTQTQTPAARGEAARRGAGQERLSAASQRERPPRGLAPMFAMAFHVKRRPGGRVPPSTPSRGPTCAQPKRSPRVPQSASSSVANARFARGPRPFQADKLGSAGSARSVCRAARRDRGWDWARLEEPNRTCTASDAPIHRRPARPRRRHLGPSWRGLLGMFSDAEDWVRPTRTSASGTGGRVQIGQPRVQSGVAAQGRGAGSPRRGAERSGGLARATARTHCRPFSAQRTAARCLRPALSPCFTWNKALRRRRAPSPAGIGLWTKCPGVLKPPDPRLSALGHSPRPHGYPTPPGPDR